MLKKVPLGFDLRVWWWRRRKYGLISNKLRCVLSLENNFNKRKTETSIFMLGILRLIYWKYIGNNLWRTYMGLIRDQIISIMDNWGERLLLVASVWADKVCVCQI